MAPGDETQLFSGLDVIAVEAARHSEHAPTADEPLAPVSAPAAARVRPTPHGSKLAELKNNPKLPAGDRARVDEALSRYAAWISAMSLVERTGPEKVAHLVALLNEYKRGLELDLIWDSDNDFLFRQRGQLKIDNSVLEEFLPWLVDPEIIPKLAEVECFAGPAPAYAATYFASTIGDAGRTTGLRTRGKDQDFTLSRRAYLKASFDPAFPPATSESVSIWLAYVAAECKTNLDKTMFQEASATSHDLKVALPGAQYFLICEYLDMTPISTSGTDIDEVLVLRGRRLASNKRSAYSSRQGRVNARPEYVAWLDANPVRLKVVERFVEHLSDLVNRRDPEEDDVVARGYF